MACIVLNYFVPPQVLSIAFASDGNTMASASADRSVITWKIMSL